MYNDLVNHMVGSKRKLAGLDPKDNPWVIKHNGVIVERAATQDKAMQRLTQIQSHSLWEATRKDGYSIENEPVNEKTNVWDVFLNGKKIDTVTDQSDDASDVKRSLVNHDGYDSGITVKRHAGSYGSNESVKEGLEQDASDALDKRQEEITCHVGEMLRKQRPDDEIVRTLVADYEMDDKEAQQTLAQVKQQINRECADHGLASPIEAVVHGVTKLLKSIKEKRITEFWVVTTPRSKQSELGDICFKSDFKSLALQFKGGLKEEEIEAVYDNEQEAKTFAQRLVDHAKARPAADEGKVPDDADPEDKKIEKLTEDGRDPEDKIEDKPPEGDDGPKVDRPEDPANPTPAEGEEQEKDTITKEYIGKSEETHYYMVGTPSNTPTDEEGADTPDDLQIVDQEGKKVWSASEQEIDPADPAEFLIRAIQELEIDEITRSVLVKYILPKLVEQDEENEPEEIENEEPTEDADAAAGKPDETLPTGDEERKNPFESKVNEVKVTYEDINVLYGITARTIKSAGDDKKALVKALVGAYLKWDKDFDSAGFVKDAGFDPADMDEAKVPDDSDAEDTKINKLIETKVQMGDDTFQVWQVDDGSNDTVIDINGQEYRFEKDFAAMWTDEATGDLTAEGLQELALDALSNMDEEEYAQLVAAGDQRSEDEIDAENARAARDRKADDDYDSHVDQKLMRDHEKFDESKVNEKGAACTKKEKRQVKHIEKAEKAAGKPAKKAEKIAHATVNKQKNEAKVNERQWKYTIDLSFLDPYINGGEDAEEKDASEIQKLAEQVHDVIYKWLGTVKDEDMASDFTNVADEFAAVDDVEGFDYNMNDLYDLGDAYSVWIKTDKDVGEAKVNEYQETFEFDGEQIPVPNWDEHPGTPEKDAIVVDTNDHTVKHGGNPVDDGQFENERDGYAIAVLYKVDQRTDYPIWVKRGDEFFKSMSGGVGESKVNNRGKRITEKRKLPDAFKKNMFKKGGKKAKDAKKNESTELPDLRGKRNIDLLKDLLGFGQ